MQRKISDLKKKLIAIVVLEVAVIAFFYFILARDVLVACVLLVLEAFLFYYSVDRFEALSMEQTEGISETLGSASKDAFLFGEVGMVMYDDNYVITWMSDLFFERGINRIGKKVLSWIPEADPLISGGTDRVSLQLDERMYEVSRKSDEAVLFFRDITDVNNATISYNEARPVVGIASFDNYEESTQYEEDAIVSSISVAVRTPLTDYCKNYGILLKRLSSSRYYMILNEKMFSDIAADHFSVLTNVRRAAQKQDVSITLSLAFARGSDHYDELDDMAIRLMDLAQSRGGDQVAVQKVGEDVKYFGGSSEATEKRSRVRVRVMSHTLRELMNRSSNVIICGHKNSDFDCMGSAIGVSKIATALHKPSCIIAKTGGIEEKLAAVMKANAEELGEELQFVTESEALNQLQEKTLVIMVDHANSKTSNGTRVLENAKKVAIIDHHRRVDDMGVKPIFVYIEAGASSATELITEMIPYCSNRVETSELDANIMLAGMTIDTGHFHVRTGSRTYEAASALRKWGADPMTVNDFLKDTYEEFNLKAYALSKAERMNSRIIITPVKGKKLTRSLMSQTADRLLDIASTEAVFVIAEDKDGYTCISARSTSKFNVQVIMEKLGGGGHMTAAAVQKANSSVDIMEKELRNEINNYLEQEERENESNPEE